MEKPMTDCLPACPVETTLTLIGDKWSGLGKSLQPILDAMKKLG